MKARWKANWLQAAASCGILVAAALAFPNVGFAGGRTISPSATLSAPYQTSNPLPPTPLAEAKELGYSVATAYVPHDQEMVVVIGDPTANVETANGQVAAGAAFVFVEPTGGWSGTLTAPAILAAKSPSAGDLFGDSVAINNNGTIVVGAPGNSGAVYVFTDDNAQGWGPVAADQKAPVFTGTAGEMFGISVGISNSGSNFANSSTYPVLVVGADQAASTDGAAYVYADSASGWSAWNATTPTISDPGGTANDLFGNSVAITSDGSTILVGSSGYGIGPNAGTDTGAAYICTLSGSKWVASPSLSFSASGAAAFGTSVAISGTSSGATAVVGAPGAASGAGAAYVYTNSGSGWSPSPTTEIADPAGLAGDLFGTSVAISSDGTVIAVGAPDAPPSSSATPALYEFDLPSHGKNPGIWSSSAKSYTYEYSKSEQSSSNFGDSAAVGIDPTSGTAWVFGGADGISFSTSNSVTITTTQTNGETFVFTQ